MLQTLLKDEAKKRGWSIRDLAKAIGTSHSTIIRAMEGELVDLGTIVKIADWMNVRPSTLLNGFGKQDKTVMQIATLVERTPELGKVLEKATDAIQNGKADPNIIDDIVAYANYKLNLSGGSGAKQSRGRSVAGS